MMTDQEKTNLQTVTNLKEIIPKKIMKIDKNSKRLKLKYPCLWTYKLIGLSKETIRIAVFEVINKKKYDLNISNKTKSGKYISMNLDINVESEKLRDSIYYKLKAHSGIIMVL